MSDFLRRESNRCLKCAKPHCKDGCPIHFDVPSFMSAASKGDLSAAASVVPHLFGEVCGYICPRQLQCKGHCVLSRAGNPIDVGAVEREVFAATKRVVAVQDNVLQGKKIAVVGGGPSGVTFACECYLHGAQVTIFEANQLLHTLRSIPNFRLPTSALNSIVDAVTQTDIQIVKKYVTDVDLVQLQHTFDVVYLSVGVAVPNTMGVCGENFATTADTFLRGNTFGHTVVVGGGNTAIDCARLNARHGFVSTIVYRRTRADMPAFASEISAAEQDGVRFEYNLAPISIERYDNGLDVTFAQTESCGRGALRVTDQLWHISCDILVVATGNKLDNKVYSAKYVPVGIDNCVNDNLYAGGDAVGRSLAVEAVADALNAANAVVMRFKQC